MGALSSSLCVREFALISKGRRPKNAVRTVVDDILDKDP